MLVTVFPAYAADDGIYSPADYENGKPVSDPQTGLITYHYVFDATPRLRYYLNGNLKDDVLADEYTAYPPAGSTSVGVRYFPLGVAGASNSPIPSNKGVIDVTDFKQYSKFTLSTSFDIEWTFVRPAEGTLDMRGFWAVYCYDGNGWYTGTVQSATTSQKLDVSPGMTSGLNYQVTGEITLPAGTAYILPMAYTNCYVDSTWQDATFICRPRMFALDFTIDSVLENSLSIQVIKDQLMLQYAAMEDMKDILGDTYDSLFGSDYSDKDEVEQNKKDSETTVEDIEQAIDILENYQESIPIGSHDVINSFLQSKPWKSIGQLVSPIMECNQFAVVMLAIVSLMNLSIILIGR